MKNEYLHDLLRENKTVIVPGLGAFVKTESTTQPIIFNAFLKFNDGLLVGYIAKKEGISSDEASRKNEIFVSGILSLLDSGRDVRINEIGVLKKDSEGKIQFQYDNQSKESVAETPVQPVVPDINDEKEKREREEAERIKREKEIEAERDSERKKREQLEEEEQRRKDSIAAEERKKREAEEERKKQLELKEEEEKKKISLRKKEETASVAENNENEIAETATEPPVRKKKKKLVLILLIVLIIGGGGGTAAFIYQEQIKKMFGMNDSADETSSVKETTTAEEKKPENIQPVVTEPKTESELNTDEIISEIPVEEKTAETTKAPEKEKTQIIKTETPVTPATSGTYYVIAGAFRNESNAESMIQKANAAGLSGSNLGKYNGLIHVSVYSSSDLNDATKKANEIKDSFPNSWVLKK